MADGPRGSPHALTRPPLPSFTEELSGIDVVLARLCIGEIDAHHGLYVFPAIVEAVGSLAAGRSLYLEALQMLWHELPTVPQGWESFGWLEGRARRVVERFLMGDAPGSLPEGVGLVCAPPPEDVAHGDILVMRAAYVGIHDRYYGLIKWRFTSLWPFSDEQAQDLAQETMTRLWRSFPRTAPHFHFSSFILTIADHVAIDELRRQGRQVHAILWSTLDESSQPDLPDPDTPDPVEAMVEEDCCDERHIQAALLVREVLSQLAPAQRECVELRDMYGFPIAKIAQQLRVTPNTIYGHLSRGRKRFAELAEPLLAQYPALRALIRIPMPETKRTRDETELGG